MKQYSCDLKSVMDEALQPYATSNQFNNIWSIVQRGQKKFKIRKIIATPLIAVICFLAISIVAYAGYNVFRNIDNTDYSFVDDSRVIGRWESVDYVRKIEDFNPSNRIEKTGLYLTSLVFLNGGKMLASINKGSLAYTDAAWTKDMVISKQERTAEKYIIEDINGITYMFYQWKSRDYALRNMEPYYYVLKKVDNNDYSDYQVKIVKEDNVDCTFIDDAGMKGKWESIDFVTSISSFNPGEKSYIGDLYLTGLDIGENGKITVITTAGSASAPSVTWTKGLIINRGELNTASKCEIKVIDGTSYMFYEWKSLDYVYRGITPCFYVLKKIE